MLPGPLAQIAVSPAQITIEAGKSAPLAVETTDRYGNVLTPSQLRWETEGDVGSVSYDNLFTATTRAREYPASLRAVARLGDDMVFSQPVDVTVTPGPVASVRATGPTGPLNIGDTARLSVVAADAYGNVVDADSTRWSADGTDGDVLQDGLYVAGSDAGTFDIVAAVTAGAVSRRDGLTVTILPDKLTQLELSPSSIEIAAGESMQLRVSPTDAHGNAIDNVVATWSTLSPGAIASQSGRLTASTIAGSYGPTLEVTVSHDGSTISATADVIVVPGPLHQVVVAPKAIEIGRGVSQQFVAVAGGQVRQSHPRRGDHLVQRRGRQYQRIRHLHGGRGGGESTRAPSPSPPARTGRRWKRTHP